MSQTYTDNEPFDQVTAPVTGLARALDAWPISLDYVPGFKPRQGRAPSDLLATAARACGRQVDVDGEPRAQLTEGDWAVRLGGHPLRDEFGYPLWLPSAGEAAEFGRQWAEAAEPEQVWVLAGVSWVAGIAGPSLGMCPTRATPLRLVWVPSHRDVTAVCAQDIRPRLTDPALDTSRPF